MKPLIAIMLLVSGLAGCSTGRWVWQDRHWAPGPTLAEGWTDLAGVPESVSARFEDDFYACGGPRLGTFGMLSTGVAPILFPVEYAMEYSRQTGIAQCLTAKGWREVAPNAPEPHFTEQIECRYPFETNCPRAAEAAGYTIPARHAQ